MDEITILFNNWFKDHSKSHWCFEGVNALILLKRCREAFNYGFSLNQEELNKTKQRLEDAELRLSNLMQHCEEYNRKEESFILAMEIEKANEYFKKHGGGCE